MKLLIAHDPTPGEQIAMADLQRGGFPVRCEALIIAVADVIPPPIDAVAPGHASPPPRVQRAVDLAQQAAGMAERQLQTTFPGWSIAGVAVADAPAWGIIRKAEEWQPDLIVVGAHRQSTLRRVVLGSVSQMVLRESPCSVRIGRRTTIDTGDSPRLLLGIDGSRDAQAAADAVATRRWPSGTAAHVVAAVDDITDPASAEFVAAGERATQHVEEVARKLADLGLTVSIGILHGDPKEIIVEEAAKWKVDCIFVGARGLNPVERLLLGSVSAAVAAHAPCSVEVVRPTRRSAP